MIRAFTRARAGALFVAVALACAALAHAEPGRPPGALPEPQRRADMLLKNVRDGGGKVEYGSAEAGATPEGVVIKDIVITSPDKKQVKVAQLEVRAYDWANATQPKWADFSFTRLVVAAEALDREGQDNFRDLGLTQLTISGELAYKFDEAEKAFEVSKLVLDLAEIGEVRMSLKLTGISPDDIKTVTGEKPAGDPGKTANSGTANNNQVMSVLSRLNIAGASVSFKDKSLVARMIRSDAKKKSMSEHAARTQIIDGLAEEKSKAEDEVTREILDAAIKFVRNPGEIAFKAEPPAPANVMMAFMTVMGNRATFKQLMGLSVSVK